MRPSFETIETEMLMFDGAGFRLDTLSGNASAEVVALVSSGIGFAVIWYRPFLYRPDPPEGSTTAQPFALLEKFALNGNAEECVKEGVGEGVEEDVGGGVPLAAPVRGGICELASTTINTMISTIPAKAPPRIGTFAGMRCDCFTWVPSPSCGIPSLSVEEPVGWLGDERLKLAWS
jgi:hypothetical protein